MEISRGEVAALNTVVKVPSFQYSTEYIAESVRCELQNLIPPPLSITED